MNSRVVLMTTAGALALAAVASSARANGLVDEAKAVVEKATARADKWDGLTSGPKAVAKKTVVYVAGDMRNGGILGVAHGLKEAADVLGWTYREIDGQGTVSGQASGLSQAIALKPDAIVVGGSDAVQQKAGLDEADKQGIVIVGWHAGPKPGPMDGAPVFANVTTDAMEMAKVAAMKAIADSNGKAGVVVFADSAYAIAKGRAMESWIKKCETAALDASIGRKAGIGPTVGTGGMADVQGCRGAAPPPKKASTIPKGAID
jgi:ribose transport system substrate-binding protein